jgi:hypothetical protein
MTVYVNSVLQTYNVAYIVTPTGGSYPCTGGTITFQATYTPANNAAILMARSLTLTQTIALPVEGSLPSSTLQTVFDRATMQIQQIQTNQLLSLQLPITSIGVNTALPTPVAYGVIGWDSAGANVVNYSPQAIVANVTNIGMGNVIGPATSTIGHIALFNNGTGTLLSDLAPGTAGNVATSNGSIWSSSALPPLVANQLRAYLVSGSPYAYGSSSGNTTLYIGPLNTGNRVTWDNGSGVLTTSALTEISFSLSSLTSTNAYSFYLYNNSGTWTAEADAWSNSTTPPSYGTDAAGRRTKSGSTNKLLIATGYCSTNGKLYNYLGECDFINEYNKAPENLYAADTTSSWTYSSATVRSANASAVAGIGRLNFWIPQEGLQAISHDFGTAAAGNNVQVGIGVNSATVYSVSAQLNGGNSNQETGSCFYNTNSLTVGFNYLQRLESNTGAGGTTFYGSGVAGGGQGNGLNMVINQ